MPCLPLFRCKICGKSIYDAVRSIALHLKYSHSMPYKKYEEDYLQSGGADAVSGAGIDAISAGIDDAVAGKQDSPTHRVKKKCGRPRKSTKLMEGSIQTDELLANADHKPGNGELPEPTPEPAATGKSMELGTSVMDPDNFGKDKNMMLCKICGKMIHDAVRYFSLHLRFHHSMPYKKYEHEYLQTVGADAVSSISTCTGAGIDATGAGIDDAVAGQQDSPTQRVKKRFGPPRKSTKLMEGFTQSAELP